VAGAIDFVSKPDQPNYSTEVIILSFKRNT